MLGGFKRSLVRKTLAEIAAILNRKRLIQAARIALIDYEKPLLIEELPATGFSVDHTSR